MTAKEVVSGAAESGPWEPAGRDRPSSVAGHVLYFGRFDSNFGPSDREVPNRDRTLACRVAFMAFQETDKMHSGRRWLVHRQRRVVPLAYQAPRISIRI